MSTNTFGITVILKAFFADNRALAKICINRDIKTVADLEEKIARIFGIRNFHLLSNEQLLPSCEDISILDNGDSVCVMPNDVQPKLLLLDEKYYVKLDLTDTLSEPLKKKRQSTNDECPVKEKKCKKKRREGTNSNYEEMTDSLEKVSNKPKIFSVNNHEDIETKREKFKSENVCMSIKLFQHLKPQHNDFATSTPNDIEETEFSYKNKEKSSSKRKKSDNVKLRVESNELKTKKKKQKAVTEEKEEQNIKNNSGEESFVSNLNSTEKDASEAEVKKDSELKFKPMTGYQTKVEGSKQCVESKFLSHNVSQLEKMMVDTSSNVKDESGVKNVQNSNIQKTPIKSKFKDKDKSTTSSDSEVEPEKNLPNNLVTAKLISTNQVKMKTVAKESSSSSSSDSDESNKKMCTSKISGNKKIRVSWSTSPLVKSSNHVKINRIPIENCLMDLSKFVFRSCDVGVVPVPDNIDVGIRDSSQVFNNHSAVHVAENKETASGGNQIESVMNTSNPLSSIPTEFSTISGCEKIKETNDTFPSKDIQMNDSNSPQTTSGEQNSQTKSVSNTSNIKENVGSGPNIENEATDKSNLKKNSVNNDTKLSRKSKQIDRNSVSYYLKLLNKIDWDVTKSISSVSADDPDLSVLNKEAKKCGQIKENFTTIKNIEDTNSKSDGFFQNMEMKKCGESVNNEIESVENADSNFGSIDSVTTSEKQLVNDKIENVVNSDSNSGSYDFITKRKRKRKHQKKIRQVTPMPTQKWVRDLPCKKLPIIAGTPKVHIRFDNNENESPLVVNTDQRNEVPTTPNEVPTTPNEVPTTPNIQISTKTNSPDENVRILQNVSLDLSANSFVDKNIDFSSKSIINDSNDHSLVSINDVQNISVGSASSFTNFFGKKLNPTFNVAENNTRISNGCELSKVDNNSNQQIALDYSSQNLTIDRGNDISTFSNLSGIKSMYLSQTENVEMKPSFGLQQPRKSMANVTIESDISFDDLNGKAKEMCQKELN